MDPKQPQEIVLQGQQIQQGRIEPPSENADHHACYGIQYEVVGSRNDCHKYGERIQETECDAK